MTRKNLFRTLLPAFGAAVAAAAAVEAGKRPAKRDLEALGIDPAAFRAIGR